MNRGQNKAGKRRTWEQVYETDGHQEARRTLLTLPEVPAPSLTSHFTKGTPRGSPHPVPPGSGLQAQKMQSRMRTTCPSAEQGGWAGGGTRE